MNIPFVDLKAQYLSIKNEIDNAIQSVIDDTAFIKGKYVQKFEEDYRLSYGVKHVISCANGTDALYISLKAMGIGPGDEVITTALSWISTSETITQTGAKVIFVDIDPEHYTINVKQIENKINNKTKAIIPVHIYGQPVNMTEIIRVAGKFNLKVIEDCAQAHFAKWEEKNVGTIGDVGTFSFFPGKNLGAYGDAGCIITNDDELAEKMRMFSNHGALIKHEHKIEGINSRMDGLQAAILSVKLKYIAQWTDLRISRASHYNKLLVEQSDIVPPKVHPKSKHVFHLYVIQVKKRKKLQEQLKKKGISTAIHYPIPLPFMQAYNYLGHSSKDFPNIYRSHSKILSLPIFPELSNDDIRYIVEKIIQFD